MLLYRAHQSPNTLSTFKDTETLQKPLEFIVNDRTKNSNDKDSVLIHAHLKPEIQSSPAFSENGVSKNTDSHLNLFMDIQDEPTKKKTYHLQSRIHKYSIPFLLSLSLVTPIFNHFEIFNPSGFTSPPTLDHT